MRRSEGSVATAVRAASIDGISAPNGAIALAISLLLSQAAARAKSREQIEDELWASLSDSESIEVFVNGGLTTLTALIFPPDGETRLAAYAETGEVRLSRLDVYAL